MNPVKPSEKKKLSQTSREYVLTMRRFRITEPINLWRDRTVRKHDRE